MKVEKAFAQKMENTPSIVFADLSESELHFRMDCEAMLYVCERTSFFDIFVQKNFYVCRHLKSCFEIEDLTALMTKLKDQKILISPAAAFRLWPLQESALRESAFAPLASKHREEAPQVL